METRSCSQSNTVLAVADSDMYARHMNRPYREIAIQGTENLLRRVKNLGALPCFASPTNILDPPSILEFPEDQAEVITTALMIDGTTLIPALVAAITNGDVEAVPLEWPSSGSFEGTRRPTMKIEITRRQTSELQET